MATLDFGLLGLNQPTPAERFLQGQREAQAEAENRLMRQVQMENLLAQREQRMASAEERRAKTAQDAKRQEFLSGLSAKMAEGGHKLDRTTLGSMLQFGMQTREDALIKLAQEGLRALDEEDLYQRESQRFGLGRAAPTTAPATPATPAAPAAPLMQGDMLAKTPFAVGPMSMPAAPAVAEPTANILASGVTREQVQNMLMSPSARMREQGKLLTSTLLKEPKAPTDVETMRALGYPITQEGYAAYQATKKQPAPTTIVQLPPQEKAERGERGKMLVKQYEDVAKAASLAAKTLPAIETQERILNAGFKTGFGTDMQKSGAALLSALGVPEATKFATDAQTFLSATQQAVLQKQLEQKGPQTEADAQRITQTGAQLGNTPDANKFIVSVAKAQLKRDVAQRNFYDKWWKDNKTYDGAEDAWFNGEGGKSLFDRPELKSFVTPSNAAPAAPTPVKTGAYADPNKERRYQEWKRQQEQRQP